MDLLKVLSEAGLLGPPIDQGGATTSGNTPAPDTASSAPRSALSSSQLQVYPGYEADQAQQAREVAAARLAHGVANLARPQSSPPEPVDIAMSTGIGLANGVVNTAGLAGSALSGFGYFPDNFVPNLFRRMDGRPLLAPDVPDYWTSWNADGIRHSIENYLGEFYQPKSRAGRYAETIGEMAPLILAGPVLGVARGTQAAGAALRELPGTLLKHAVAPGAAVQALQELAPDSGLGKTVQEAYPVVRRGLPVALAAKRYLSGRVRQ